MKCPFDERNICLPSLGISVADGVADPEVIENRGMVSQFDGI